MAETDSLLEDVDNFSSSSNGHVHGNPAVSIKSGRTRDAVYDSSPPDAPVDRYFFVYAVFYTFGMCSVLPWNMFITAKNYFDFKFAPPEENATNPDTGVTAGPTLKPATENDLVAMYEAYFSVAAQIPNVLIVLVNMGIKHRVTLKVRMITSLTGMLVIFTFTTVLTRIDTENWQTQFFIVTLVSVVVINCFSGIFQGSVFGLGGLLPKKYTQSLMAGQGLGGILPALVSIICIATIEDVSLIGFVYFLLAVLCIFFTFAAYLVLPRNQFAEYYLNKQVTTEVDDVGNLSRSLSSSFEEKKTPKPPFWFIFKKIWIPAVMVFLTFAVTLGNFPAVVSQIHPMHHTEFTDVYFTPIFCYLLFNTMDFLGRSLSVLQVPSQNRMGVLSLLVLLRLAFFPLFALCNASPATRYSEVVFTHDAYPIVFMIFFAFSNGYLGSLCMIYGPKFVESKYQETAGNMMAFFLVLGLATGSFLSIGVLRLL
ncbi:equilibrative nucleoside transporter 1-like [Diadema antillarum]|uniref:equilibrative nucleoside transporter 1-like n=1 Tax=Diadema antillarum TaxID=105358 RepID=UPI003A8AA60D